MDKKPVIKILGVKDLSEYKFVQILEINDQVYVDVRRKYWIKEENKSVIGKAGVCLTQAEFESIRWSLAFRKEKEVIGEKRKVNLKWPCEWIARLILDKMDERKEIQLYRDEINALAKCDVGEIIASGFDEVDAVIEKMIGEVEKKC